MKVIQKRQLYNAISMIPGIIMVLILGPKNKYPKKIAIYGYIITCIGSIIYHLHASVKEEEYINWKFLRLDLFCQQAGIYIGMLCSQMGIQGVLTIIPLTICSMITNLNYSNERIISFISNSICIIIACLFAPKVYKYFIIAGLIFIYSQIKKHTYIGTVFHFMIHICMYTYYESLS